MHAWGHGHPPLMCCEQWELNTEGVICHKVGRSQEVRGTTVLSHIYPVSFFFVHVVHGKEKSQWSRGVFAMLLYSYSFSKLCVTFSNFNFLSAEQDTILKYFWIGGKLISLPSVWAGHPSPLVVFHFHDSASMSDFFFLSPLKQRISSSLQTKSWWLAIAMIHCLGISHNMSRLHPDLSVWEIIVLSCYSGTLFEQWWHPHRFVPSVRWQWIRRYLLQV